MTGIQSSTSSENHLSSTQLPISLQPLYLISLVQQQML